MLRGSFFTFFSLLKSISAKLRSRFLIFFIKNHDQSCENWTIFPDEYYAFRFYSYIILVYNLVYNEKCKNTSQFPINQG